MKKKSDAEVIRDAIKALEGKAKQEAYKGALKKGRKKK